MKARILIADDTDSVRSALHKLLRAYGYDTILAENGAQALDVLRHQRVDLLLLDLDMPVMDGYQVIDRLRNELHSRIPVFIISGKMDEYDIVYVLGLGADDYVTKPFVPIVLEAKINAILRRAQVHAQDPALVHPPFRLHQDSHKVYKHEEEILLSETEFRLLQELMLQADKVCLPEYLFDHVWDGALSDRNTLMVYIHKLRSKLEEDPRNPVYIKTIRGSGYCFCTANCRTV